MNQVTITNLRLHAEREFSRYGLFLAGATAFTLPLKLTISYVFLFPLVLLWIFAYWSRLADRIHMSREVIVPLFLFLILVTLSSLFGVDLSRSLPSVPGLFFFALLILAVAEVVRIHGPLGVLLPLIAGQSIAALHTVIEAGFPNQISRLFLGAVTESGQLAIVTIVSLGLVFSKSSSSANPQPGQAHTPPPYGLVLGCVLASVCWIGIAHLIARYDQLACGSAICASSMLLWSFISIAFLSIAAVALKVDYLFRLPPGSQLVRALYLVFVPLLIAALVLNLKRGPWMGVLIAGSVLTLLFHRRLLLPLLAFSILSYLSLEPVRQRIAEIPEHFYITGGRSVLWDIGVDLATRYPLGVGFRNSRFLQTFSEEIPLEINHFHNNLINITVECGWIALAVFVWWVLSTIRFSLHPSRFGSWKPLASAIGLGLLSWQIAGLVEYNWGDSEVRMLVYVVVGVLIGMAQLSGTTQPSNRHKPQ
jgi:hypothetical protein